MAVDKTAHAPTATATNPPPKNWAISRLFLFLIHSFTRKLTLLTRVAKPVAPHNSLNPRNCATGHA